MKPTYSQVPRLWTVWGQIRLERPDDGRQLAPKSGPMMVVAYIVTGVLLLAHGLVHLLYLAPDVPEFSLDQSWVVPETARRQLGLGPMVATMAAVSQHPPTGEARAEQ